MSESPRRSRPPREWVLKALPVIAEVRADLETLRDTLDLATPSELVVQDRSLCRLALERIVDVR